MKQTLSNQSHVTFNYAGQAQSKTNHSNVVNTTMNDRMSFTVEKTSTNECFRPGENIIYFIKITNTGCDNLCSFNVCDNLGGDCRMTYVDGSARLFVDGVMKTITPTSTSPLAFDIDETLVRDEEMILQFSALVGEDVNADEITNEVKVCGYSCPRCGCQSEDSRCVCECATLTLPVCRFAEVLISKSVSDENVCCRDELDYFITLTNIGNIDATNVIVTDSMPQEFTATEVHMENNGDHYMFAPSEYTIDANNLLTVPNATGRAILVPAIAPGEDNTTRLRIHGHV